ncbi:MAG: carboxypeptidase-like regulatory domain-containing protein, partial [Christiangramia sp.]
MRRILIIILISLGQLVSAQENSKKVSVEFNDEPLISALHKLEVASATKFYYAESFIPDKTVTGNYSNSDLQSVLDDLFEDTILNYYFLEGRGVILTRNSLIYDELPEGFFGLEEETEIAEDKPLDTESSTSPIFYKTNNPSKEVETIRIGKENIRNRKKSYRLSGYALDKKTGEPISNLAVVVNNTRTGISTDINGHYEIRLKPGANIVETRSLTNENVTKRIIVFNDGTYNFELDESLEMLGEVQISANANKNVDNANAGEEEIDIENIKNIPLVLGERDIMKVATTLPGISTTGEGSAGFNVRGGKEDQNLILLDDAVIYNPAHFFGIFSAINPFTTGEATIFKGNIPARYGGRLSSVFDIKTKDAATNEFKGEASIGPVTSNLAIQLPIVKEKSGLMVGGRSTYSDYILRSLKETELQNSTAFFYDGIIKYNHQLNENNKLSTTAYVSKDKFSITSDSIYSYENRIITLHYNHRFNDRNRGALILTNSNYRFNINYENSLQDNFDSGYEINESEIKLDLKYIPNTKHHFNYGISGKLYNIDPGYIAPIGDDSGIVPLELNGEKGFEAGAWLADDFEVNEKLLLSAGVRFSLFTALGQKQVRLYRENSPKNDNSVIDIQDYGANEPIKTYANPEVRLSARYYVTPELSLKASFNNTYQYI